MMRSRIGRGQSGAVVFAGSLESAQLQYYTPKLEPGWLQPGLSTPYEHFGGLPVGLPHAMWPRCGECGALMIHIAQLFHHDERLDLGKAGRQLFVFMCEGEEGCETWDAESGASAVLIVEEDEVVEGETSPPGEVRQETEVRVDRWIEGSDKVPADVAPHFYDYDAFVALDKDVMRSATFGTRAGSVPSWVQMPEGPGAPFRFVLQMDDLHRFDGPVPTPDELGCTVSHRDGDNFDNREPKKEKPGAPNWARTTDEGWFISAANYGGGGTAYVFVDSAGDRPTGKMLWQCG